MAQAQAPHEEIAAWEPWVLPLASAAVLLASVLDWAWWRPGFAAYDEQGQLDLLQAWREGGGLPWRAAAGCLQRGLLALLVRLFGPGDAVLHLPALLAVGAEGLLLYLWLRPRLGERAALWSGSALIVGASALAQARSLLSFSLLPALWIGFALALDKLRRPWQGLLWGFACALMAMDYEAWPIGWACLAGPWWERSRRRDGFMGYSLLGAALGLALVAAALPDWRDYLASRHGLSAATAPAGRLLVENVQSLLSWGHRLPMSYAVGHPFPPPWLWLPLAIGLPLLWQRWRWGVAILVLGCLPLGLQDTALEPQRLCFAWPGLAAAAGLGLAWILGRGRVGRLAAIGLLCFGLVDEGIAWRRSIEDPVSRLAYGPSQAMLSAASALKRYAPSEGWDLIGALGTEDDGAWRWCARSVPKGRRPVLLLPWSYRPALAKAQGRWTQIGASSDRYPLLYFPSATEVPALKAQAVALAALRAQLLPLRPSARRDRARALLEATQDPWQRTLLWELWLQASAECKTIDAPAYWRAVAEPLRSATVPAFFLGAVAGTPKEAYLRARVSAIDPRLAF